MKFKGRQLLGPRKKIVPIIRSEEEGGNIIFIVKGVTAMDDFNALCPMPIPPRDRLPGGKFRENVEDSGYKDQINRWWQKRTAWIALTALRETPNLEWEKVKFDDPETWTLWSKELEEAGFAEGEISRIMSALMEVNGLNENLVEEARQSFLISQESQANELSDSPQVALQST